MTTSPAIIRTDTLPVNHEYTKTIKEIESNPVPFRQRISAARAALTKSFRARGFNKLEATELTSGVLHFYQVWSKWYNTQPIAPGTVDIQRLENELQTLIKTIETADTNALVELYWRPR